MHLHKIIFQIMLILSILNSVLAAPAVSVREMHEARRALAVRENPPGTMTDNAMEPSPDQSGPHSTNPPGPHEPEVYHGAPEEFIPPASAPIKPPQTQWQRQKIMTPEKIKAIKYVGLAGLATSAYLSLLIPEITRDDSNGGQS